MSVQSKTPNSAPRFAPPLYGEAAAIHAMYQGLFIEQQPEQKPPPPRTPRRGLLQRLAATVSSLVPAQAYDTP